MAGGVCHKPGEGVGKSLGQSCIHGNEIRLYGLLISPGARRRKALKVVLAVGLGG
jgi:hypothetical protein